MRTRNECWMDLHRLAAGVEEIGLTRQERLDNLVQELMAMPPLVRRELMREMRFLLAELTDLEPLVIHAVNASEEPQGRPRHVG
jgi:hypothetical protein